MRITRMLIATKASRSFKLKRHQEALAAYERAAALEPDLAEAWLGRGNVFGELKRFDEALVGYGQRAGFKTPAGRDLAKPRQSIV